MCRKIGNFYRIVKLGKQAEERPQKGRSSCLRISGRCLQRMLTGRDGQKFLCGYFKTTGWTASLIENTVGEKLMI